MAKDPFAGARYMPPEYHPRSVVLSMDQMGQHIVTDKSYGSERVSTYPTSEMAKRVTTQRKASIQGALTRRQNKRNALRETEATKAGVTRKWLGEKLTQHEADAWLGLDFEAK